MDLQRISKALIWTGWVLPCLFCSIYWIFDKCKALQWDWGSEVFWGRIKKYGMSLCLYQEGFCFVLLGIWAGTVPLSLIVVHYDSE